MYYKETAHIFHLIMCLLTGFIWIPVWACCALSNSQHNKMVERMENRQILILNQHRGGGQ